MKIVVSFENHAILSFVCIVTATVAVICILPLQTLLNLSKGMVKALMKAVWVKADLSFCLLTRLVQVRCEMYWCFLLGQSVLLYCMVTVHIYQNSSHLHPQEV